MKINTTLTSLNLKCDDMTEKAEKEIEKGKKKKNNEQLTE